MRNMSRRSFVLGSVALAASARSFGQARGAGADAATSGPLHHFLGHGDKSSWDANGRFLLAHETSFAGRPPAAGETAVVGLVDRVAGDVFRPIGATAAWNWELGALPRWLPCAPEREVVYSVRSGDRWAALRVDVCTGRRRLLSAPVYAIDPDGMRGLSVNVGRLAWTRPGHGYEGILDPGRHVAAPEDDGVLGIDMECGDARVIVTLARLALFRPLPEFVESYHWVHHPQFNTDGTRFAFAHCWRRPGQPWRTRLFTADVDGGTLRLVFDQGLVSRFTWRDARTLLLWTEHPSLGQGFFFLDERTGALEPFAKGIITQDGHASFSPDGRWVAADTYPDQRMMRMLMLVRVRDGLKIEVGRFASPPEWPEPARCDLHPRWSPDGTRIGFDSAHDKTRQVYVVDVARYVKET